MPAVQPPPSRAAAEAVYDDLKDVILRTVRRFVRRYRTDFEETLSRANLHFVEALRGYDPAMGTTIEQRVVYLIKMRLLDWKRTDAERAAKLTVHQMGHRAAALRSAFAQHEGEITDQGNWMRGKFGRTFTDTDFGLFPDAPDPTPSPTDPALDDLSPDARAAVDLLLFSDAVAPPDPGRRVGPADARAAVRAYLRREKGWSRDRVATAFVEIRAVLGR